MKGWKNAKNIAIQRKSVLRVVLSSKCITVCIPAWVKRAVKALTKFLCTNIFLLLLLFVIAHVTAGKREKLNTRYLFSEIMPSCLETLDMAWLISCSSQDSLFLLLLHCIRALNYIREPTDLGGGEGKYQTKKFCFPLSVELFPWSDSFCTCTNSCISIILKETKEEKQKLLMLEGQ